MIKLVLIFNIIINLLFWQNTIADTIQKKETIITTDGGIEVYQNEKYYDLSNNVDIRSKNFDLTADNALVYYEKDFYDLIKVIAIGKAYIVTSQGAIIRGDKVTYQLKDEKFFIIGNGIFTNKELHVEGNNIKGNFIKLEDETFVDYVEATDPNIVFIKNKEMKSYSKSAKYKKETEILELFDDVKIIKNQEVTTGDYANINMLTNNYFIKTNNNAIVINGYLIKPNDNKVKLLIDAEEDLN